MSQYPNNGFNIRTAPGTAPAGGGESHTQPHATYPPMQPPVIPVAPASGNDYQHAPRQQSQEEDVRTSTSTRHLIFGLIEICAGVCSNLSQIFTTIFSFIQIQMGTSDQTFALYGPWGGWGQVAMKHPAYIWVAIVLAIGAQILLQAGCQILSRTWKKEQQAVREGHQHYGFVQVLISKEAGWFFTGLGFVLDVVGDIGFAIAFGVPWLVCLLFGLMMNGLSTFVLYDGDERFHYAYPIWWQLYTGRRLWKQAAQERARLMHGVSRDGRALVPPQR